MPTQDFPTIAQQARLNSPSSSSQSRRRPYVEQVDRNISRRDRSDNNDRNAGEKPSESASILNTPNGEIEISGGTFNATAGHHLNVTINNARPSRGYKTHNKKTRKRKRASNCVEDESVSEGDASTRTAKSVKLSDTPELEDRASPMTLSQTSYSLYYRHLAYKGRGSPLWIPQPNKNLPVEYQRTGMQIGDVGIISSRGSFVFLFNICYPPEHPINRNKVPHNFSPLVLNPTDEIRVESEFGPGSYLSSASIRKSNRDMNSGGLIFESSAAEGAILTMPVGSKSEELVPVLRFERYAAQHAEEWYRYVIEVRECPVSNGDIRLVIGHDKTSAWGMATFSGSTEHNSLYLSFRPITEDSAGTVYGWEYSGMAEVRNGPDPRDVADLRRGDLSQEQVAFDNQCLFLRTVNVKLRDSVWKSLASNLGMIDLNSDDSQSGGADTSRGRFQTNQTQTSHPNRSSQSAYNSSSSCRQLSMRDEIDLSTRVTPSAYISHPVPALAEHPSDILNDVLLNLFPEAKMAVTNDNDWLSVLTQDDNCLPPKEELLSRMRASTSFRVRVEDGVSFLQRGERDTFDTNLPLPNLEPDTLFENAVSVSEPSQLTVRQSTLNPATISAARLLDTLPPDSPADKHENLEARFRSQATDGISVPAELAPSELGGRSPVSSPVFPLPGFRFRTRSPPPLPLSRRKASISTLSSSLRLPDRKRRRSQSPSCFY